MVRNRRGQTGDGRKSGRSEPLLDDRRMGQATASSLVSGCRICYVHEIKCSHAFGDPTKSSGIVPLKRACCVLIFFVGIITH